MVGSYGAYNVPYLTVPSLNDTLSSWPVAMDYITDARFAEAAGKFHVNLGPTSGFVSRAFHHVYCFSYPDSLFLQILLLFFNHILLHMLFSAVSNSSCNKAGFK